jgi:hypothetical protein
MATTHLQIPDIQANQNSKEVTANEAHDLLDKALNANVSVAMSVGINNLTTGQTRENFVIELTGTPGAGFTVEMPDTNKRTLAIVNNSNGAATVQNPSAGGTGQPVIQPGEASIFHFDGTNFFDFTALALSVTSWIGLTDTPANFTGASGRIPMVNIGETALEFVGTAAKHSVIAATTVNGALATAYENGDIIDGVTLATGDRILIKDQTAGQENGIYTVNATGAPTRVADFDDALDMEESPVMIPVLDGTQNGSTVWIHTTTANPIIVDTTPLTFTDLLSPGTFLSLTDAPSSYVNQSGMAVRVNNNGGTPNALEFVPTDIKIPVRVATTVAGTLATDFEGTGPADTVDGVTLATGDRILIKNQATASENGIYTVNATGAPTRALDLDANDQDVILGALVSVVEGTANANTLWMHESGANIGTDNVVFAQVGGGTTNRWIERTLQTTDATVTNIASGVSDSLDLASGEAKAVRGFLIATEASSANSYAASFFAAGKNNGGTSAELAAAIIVAELDASPAGAWNLTVDVDDATDTIRIRATGEAATTIDWRVQYEVITEDNT